MKRVERRETEWSAYLGAGPPDAAPKAEVVVGPGERLVLRVRGINRVAILHGFSELQALREFLNDVFEENNW